MTTVSWMPEVAANTVDTVGMEVVHLACFVLGFVVFNTTYVQQTIRTLIVKADPVTLKYMTAHSNSGNYADVWDLWTTLKPSDLTAETLCLAVEALVELGRAAEAAAVVTDALDRQPQLRTPACAKVVLEALATSAAAARAVHAALCARGVVPDVEVCAAMRARATTTPSGSCARKASRALRKLRRCSPTLPSSAGTWTRPFAGLAARSRSRQRCWWRLRAKAVRICARRSFGGLLSGTPN